MYVISQYTIYSYCQLILPITDFFSFCKYSSCIRRRYAFLLFTGTSSRSEWTIIWKTLHISNVRTTVQYVGRLNCLGVSPETHTKRHATQPVCLPQLAGRWETNIIEIVYGEEKIFCTGPTRGAKAEPKSLVPARHAQWANQERTPFISPLWVPFTSVPKKSAGATPL